MSHHDHWSQDPYWTEALDQFQKLQKDGIQEIVLNLNAIQEVIFNGDGPAYKLMDGMISVKEHEGMEGCRGAPRLVLALLVRLRELSERAPKVRTDALAKLDEVGFREIGEWFIEAEKPHYKLTALNSAKNVLYAFVVGETPQYIGKTAVQLNQRMSGYQNPGPTQPTNKRVRKLIQEALQAGVKVRILALPDSGLISFGGFHLNLAAALEGSLVRSLQPKWNIQGK